LSFQSSPAPIYTPTDLNRFVDLLDAVLIPPGDAVVYVANTRDGKSAAAEGSLWTVGASGANARLVYESDDSQSRPAVSANGQSLAWLQDTDGAAQLYVGKLPGNEASRLTDFARGVGGAGPRWSPDSTRIAFDGCPRPPRDKALSYRITRPIWRRDGMGLVEDILSDVWVVPAGGGTPEQMTHEEGVITFLSWSPDGSRILYGVFAGPDSIDYDIKIVDYPSGNIHSVTTGRCLVYPAVGAWLPDGKVTFTSPWSINKRIELMVFDPATGTTESRTPDIDGQLFGLLQAGVNSEAFEPRIIVDSAGTYAYVYIQQGGSYVIHKIALSGERSVEPVSDPAYSAVPVDVCGSHLLTIRTSFKAPADIHLIDLDTGDASALTSLNGAWLSGTPFDVHHLSFQTPEGPTVEGWFLEPHGGSRPYPTVLHIHGGPFAGHGEIFSVDNMVLTSAGYGVLSVNFRGGSGYGDDFASTLIGDWGRYDMADVLQGVEVAVEAGLADTDRVASFGLSGGGYMTSWLLTHSDRFKAGVAECPVTDWAGMLASDIGNVVSTWMDSAPGHGPESMAPYLRMAPSTYAADCSAPLLIVEHEADLRCPVSQGDIFYNSLHLAGKKVEMLRLPGVPHVPYGADLRVRVERAEALVDWMDRYVR